MKMQLPVDNRNQTIEPYLLVSNSVDSPELAKRKWFSHIDNCIIITFAKDTVLHALYRSQFENWIIVSNADVGAALKCCGFGSVRPLLIVALNPPDSASLTSVVSDSLKAGCHVLCHFTQVNKCFDPLPRIFYEYEYEFSGYPDPTRSGPKWFTINNCNHHLEPVMFPDKRGIYVVDIHPRRDQSYVEEAEKCIRANFTHYGYKASKKDQQQHDEDKPQNLGSVFRLCKEQPIVFVKSGDGSLFQRYLYYKPHECPDLLIPGYMHIFFNMSVGAIKELCRRVETNPVLNTALFVCVGQFSGDELNAIPLSNDRKICSGKSIERLANSELTIPDQPLANTFIAGEIEQESNSELTNSVKVLATVKERVIVAEQDTELRFFVKDLWPGQKLLLKSGFPLDGKYALFVDGQHVCDSVVDNKVATFVLPEVKGPTSFVGSDKLVYPPYCWVRIDMTNATPDKYIYSPSVGRFYFSEYELIKPDGGFYIINPHACYRFKTNLNELVRLRTGENIPFTFVSNSKEGMECSYESQDAKHSVHRLIRGCMFEGPNVKSTVDAQIILAGTHNNRFFPKKIEVTEVYMEPNNE